MLMLLALAVTAGALFLKTVVRITYNLFFHPLKTYPGPLLNRATRLSWVLEVWNGRLAVTTVKLHQRFGPIVRIAPNELSFIEPEAWRDIYGHRIGPHANTPELGKSPSFYNIHPSLPQNIVNAPREQHAMLRRMLSHGFSDKSMREQEPIIQGYVSLLIRRLRESCNGGQAKIDLVNWYTWTTFDIIGDLALGSSFKCLQDSGFHPWVRMFSRTPEEGATIVSMKALGMDWPIGMIVKYGMRFRRESLSYVRTILHRRMQLGVERPDLIEGLLRKEREAELEFPELEATASTLVFAGSETTATLLSGVTYLLLKNPAALERLVREVRTAFQAEDEITFTSVQDLVWMLACLKEALRLYPPVATALPRMVPAGGATIVDNFVPQGTIVGVPQYAANQSEGNWKDASEFHPERFMGDRRYESDKQDVLQPFSVGPRNCIGKNLAYAEMRVILARIIFNFDLRLSGESDGWRETQQAFFLWKKPSLYVHITPVRH